jgi:hypothetical protein
MVTAVTPPIPLAIIGPITPSALGWATGPGRMPPASFIHTWYASDEGRGVSPDAAIIIAS